MAKDKEMKKGFSKKWLALPIAAALTTLFLYTNDGKKEITHSPNVKRSYLEKVIQQTKTTVSNPRVKPIKKSISILNMYITSYYENLLRHNPNTDEAWDMHYNMLKKVIKPMAQVNPDFKNWVMNADRNMSHKNALKKYFGENGYLFTDGDLSESENKIYRSFFLAKILSEYDKDIPIFDTEKKHKIHVINYSGKNADIFPLLIYKYKKKGKWAQMHFKDANSDSNEVIIDGSLDGKRAEGLYNSALAGKIGTRKYSNLAKQGKKNMFEIAFLSDDITNIEVHEGMHSYIGSRRLLDGVEDASKHDECLAFLNEIINGANPDPVIDRLCNSTVSKKIIEYDQARRVICPCYGNIRDMDESKIREVARDIFKKEYSWIKIK